MILGFLPACGESLEEVETTDEFGYTERYTRRKSDYAREGLLRRFDSKGQLVEEAQYENDTLNGLRILYFPGQDTQTVETYRRGQFEGPWRTYYENGVLKLEGVYENNTMSGEWRAYYDTGELAEIVTFQNNEENGPFVEFYRNGNKKAEGGYLNGDYEHGLLQEYNEEGELIRKANCEHGICRTIWRANSESSDNSGYE